MVVLTHPLPASSKNKDDNFLVSIINEICVANVENVKYREENVGYSTIYA